MNSILTIRKNQNTEKEHHVMIKATPKMPRSPADYQKIGSRQRTDTLSYPKKE